MAIELSNGQHNALCQLLLLLLLRWLQLLLRRLQRLLLRRRRLLLLRRRRRQLVLLRRRRRRRRRQLVLLRLLLRHAAGGCGTLRLARGPRHITACHPMQSTRREEIQAQLYSSAEVNIVVRISTGQNGAALIDPLCLLLPC